MCVLNTKQKKCIILMVSGQKTQKQIADELSVSENTISNWKKNDEFMTEYTSSLKKAMKDVAAKAFQTEIKLLSARSEMVRLLAAKDVLDRAGFKADEKIQIEGGTKVVIVDDLDE